MIVLDSDFSGYYNDCILQRVSTKEYLLVRGCEVAEGNVIVSDLEDTFKVPVSDLVVSFPTGFIQVGDTVVYTSLRQGRSYKKALHINNLVHFFPQKEEYKLVGKSLRRLDIKDIIRNTYTDIEDIDKVLETKDAVAIHKTFAIVKKGTYENPVVYHRKNIIAQYVDGEFVPLEGQSNMYVDKLKWELGLYEY